MKLFDIDISKFVDLLEHAQGNINLVMNDGSEFNLSSKLSQLYCLKILIKNSAGNKISPELTFENTNDKKMFAKLLAYHYIKLTN